MLASRTCLQSMLRGLLADSRACTAAHCARPVALAPLRPAHSASQHRHRLAAKKQSSADGEPPARPKRTRKASTSKKSAADAAAADAPPDTSPPKRRGRPPKAKAAAAAAVKPPTPPTPEPPTTTPASPSPPPPEPPTTPAATTAAPEPTTAATPQPTTAPASQPEPLPSEPAPEPTPAPAPVPVNAPEPTPAPAPVSAASDAAGVAASGVPAEQAPAALAVNRQGYQSFEMDGVELLIAETTTGQLKLSDCYVFDSGAGLYAEPEKQGPIPDRHATYQIIPWTEEYLGDMMTHKEPWTKIHKMVFIPVLREEPYELKLDDVYIFSADSRKLVKMPVERAGPFVVDPVLRIREDKVTIEDSSYMPSFMEVQGAGEVGRAPEPAIDAAWLAELQEELAGYRDAQRGPASPEPVAK